MKPIINKFSAVCILSVLVLIGLKAQQSVNASGGDASGSGGSVSFSVGQAFYTANKGTTGFVMQGVQQPYRIQVVAVPGELRTGFTLSAYPNPVSDILMLRIENDNCENLFYRLSDINGRQIRNSEITDRQTCISMGGLMPAVYYLSVIKTGSLEGIVVFKIIKN